MCILIVKEMGREFPSYENIETACKSNPDGFSMAYSDGKSLQTFRTMDRKKFLKQYDAIMKANNKDKIAMIIHARIATHGSRNLRNCHCWVNNGIAFAHNGILSIANRGDMTDSQTFFDDIFIPAYKFGGWKGGKRAAEAIIRTSKFAFLFKDGRIERMGDFTKDNGCFYSNHSYIPVKRYDYWGCDCGKSKTTFSEPRYLKRISLGSRIPSWDFHF